MVELCDACGQRIAVVVEVRNAVATGAAVVDVRRPPDVANAAVSLSKSRIFRGRPCPDMFNPDAAILNAI
jgi:hypothetical protein